MYVVAAVALQAQFGACEELLPERADWLAPVRAWQALIFDDVGVIDNIPQKEYNKKGV